MGIELTTLSESTQAFQSKMRAARFFFDHIQKLYQPGGVISKIPDELFYYVDAAIFEMHAASQMLLQMINVKSATNIESYRVNWGSNFKKQLRVNDGGLFTWWENFNASPEFHILESMRQYISHRGGSFLQAETSEDGSITLISIPVRFRYYQNLPQLKSSGKSIELLDELNALMVYLDEQFKDLQKA